MLIIAGSAGQSVQQAAGSSPQQQQPACVLLTCSSTQQAQEVWDLLQRHAQQQAVDVEAGEVSHLVAGRSPFLI
jgi:hypothetical protein